jgi:hypothetical protein
MAPKNLFICYRRDDAAGYARSIYDRLNARFPNRVFMDVEGIVPGSDYSQVIQNTVGTCHALLAIIGKDWATMVDGSNQRRIDLADDYVRHEIGRHYAETYQSFRCSCARQKCLRPKCYRLTSRRCPCAKRLK